MIAEQQDLIDRRADSLLRRVDQAEAHIARGILNAVEVARNLSFRREDHDAARMCELPGRRIELVMKSHRGSDACDVLLITRKKVPSFPRAATAITREIRALLLLRECGGLARIDTQCHDVKLLAHVELLFDQGFG